MKIKWNDTGKVENLLRPDALRMVRRLRAKLVVEETAEPPKPEATVPAKPKPEANDADSD